MVTIEKFIINEKTVGNKTVLVIPNGVSEIEVENTPNFCYSLREIRIPASVKNIVGRFHGSCNNNCCKNLKNIVIDKNNANYYAFNGLVYNKDKTKLIFAAPGIVKAKLLDSVKEIEDSAFESCNSLSNVQLNNGLEKIGRFAFQNCNNLEKIVLPKTVKEIRDQVFLGCKKLKQIVISKNNNYYCCFDGLVYNKDKTRLILAAPGIVEAKLLDSVKVINSFAFCDCESLINVQLNRGLEFIGAWAFKNCSKLKKILLPTTVKIISERVSLFNNLKYIYKDCNNLKKVIIDNNNPNFYSCDGLIYNKDKTKLIFAAPGIVEAKLLDSVQEIGYEAFAYCHRINKFIASKGLKTIGEKSFIYCEALNFVKLNYGLEKIGNRAFDNCSNLETMVVPKTVKEIDQNAFNKSDKFLNNPANKELLDRLKPRYDRKSYNFDGDSDNEDKTVFDNN